MSVIDVLEADDVVLVEIGPRLHLNEERRDLARVGEPMLFPIGMKVDWFSLRSSSSSPLVTSSVPFTMTQCSERWKWLCRDSFAPGFTMMHLTW